MKTQFSFDDYVAEYEEWFDRYPWVFRSEVEVLREMLPVGEKLTGIEVGVGTGRFSQALGIKEGVEPSENMRALAIDRGMEIMAGVAESLPYADHRFDFVLMNFCISYLDDINKAFREAHRVLKGDGVLVVGFIDKDSILGRQYEERKAESTFYRHAKFYSVEKVISELNRAGFKYTTTRQTLFGELDTINEFQPSKPGHGEGSYVIVRAAKRKLPD
jgi:ubiquinone/menaquinone biosynthesis C-methylase UbiE